MNNSVMMGGMTTPQISAATTTGGVVIRHREYLRDINSAVDFTNIQFPVNPGITSTFPWLSQIATSFEEYKFRGIVFEFKSMAADVVLSGAASTALGTVIMGTKYNVLESPFTNKFEMENWEYTASCKPSCPLFHPIECKGSQTPVDLLYIRSSNSAPVSGDLRLYDLCNFNVAVQGMQNVTTSTSVFTTIGELWVTYEVELYKPKLEEDIQTQSAHFDIDATLTSPTFQLGTPNSTYPFGTNGSGIPLQKFYPSPRSRSNLPCYIVADQPNTGFSNGRLYITDSIAKRLMISFNYHWGTGAPQITAWTPPTAQMTVLAEPPIPPVVNGSVGMNYISAWLSDTAGFFDAKEFSAVNPSVAPQRYIYNIVVELTADVAYLVFSGFTYTGNGTSNFDFWITEVAPNQD